MIRQTSLLAYDELQLILPQRHQEYIEALRKLGHPATDLEVSRFAGHSDPNYFRPRRNELVKLGLITETGRRRCSVSKKTALIWWFA
ncbi:MAG TPA: hypothetical protein VMY59_01160 [Candidatus Thermoplasmatota archaeon]|nr:hypothetical protein [Candidatus Thermoplasmatota archaeon]